MQAPYPAPLPPKKTNVVLIVLLIVGGVVLLTVAIIGVLAILAVSGTRKYINASKAAEATNGVNQIAIDAQIAYTDSSTLCSSASHPVPAQTADVCGKKYMSTQSDWQADMAKNGGFFCLRYEMNMPQYYQYDYQSTGSSFTATAKGDLDCDFQSSTFSVKGNVGPSGLTLDPMKQTDPDE